MAAPIGPVPDDMLTKMLEVGVDPQLARIAVSRSINKIRRNHLKTGMVLTGREDEDMETAISEAFTIYRQIDAQREHGSYRIVSSPRDTPPLKEHIAPNDHRTLHERKIPHQNNGTTIFIIAQ